MSDRKISHLQLVSRSNENNVDTAELLHRLATEARQGKIVGAIVIPLYTPNETRRYALWTSGLAAQNATLASGAVGACKVLLDELALQEAGLVDV